MTSLPSIPAVVFSVVELIERDAEVKEIAALVATEQVLSARILKLINSPLYGFPGRVAGIPHAIVLLGVNVLRGLLMGAPILAELEKRDRLLWRHSTGAAIIARLIAQELGAQDVEEIATAALLHDIGRMIMKFEYSAEYGDVRRLIQDDNIPALDAEQEVLGFDHARLGGRLASLWKLPERLSEPIRFHHQPESSTKFPQETAITHLADVLVKLNGFGNREEEILEPLDPTAWERLHMTDEKLETIMRKMEVKINAFALDDFVSDKIG